MIRWTLLFFDKLRLERKEPEFTIAGKQDNTDRIELIKAFVTQFAENQNHNQKLFIQFLSSVLIVLVAYAFVYSNTADSDGMLLIKGSSAGSKISAGPLTSPHTITIKPKVFSVYKHEEGGIISFSIVNLLGIYMFAQLVLLVLSSMILHLGYSYRRDQSVIHYIRRSYFSEKEFKAMFGDKVFQSHGKGLFDYLPNFNSILFSGIVLIQLTLAVTLFEYLHNFDRGDQTIFTFIDHDVTYTQLGISIFFPILVNIFFYTFYYNKYDNNVNGISTYLPLVRVLKSPRYQALIFTILYILAIGGEIYFAWQTKSRTATTTVLFTLIIIIPLLFQATVLKHLELRTKEMDLSRPPTGRRISAHYYLRIIQGVCYMVFGTILFAIGLSYLEYFDYPLKTDRNLLWIPSIAYLLKLLTPWIINLFYEKDFKNSVAEYLKQHTRFFATIFYFTVLAFFVQLKWLDSAFAIFFGAYSFVVGRRTFVKARFGIYDGT